MYVNKTRLCMCEWGKKNYRRPREGIFADPPPRGHLSPTFFPFFRPPLSHFLFTVLSVSLVIDVTEEKWLPSSLILIDARPPLPPFPLYSLIPPRDLGGWG